jgi:hypothetical protein
MMPERTPEDRLREEYFDLLPEIRRVLWQLEAEIRYYTLPILHSLKPYEQLIVESRVKECESALTTLKTLSLKKEIEENEGRVLDPQQSGNYSILNLSILQVFVFRCSRKADWLRSTRNSAIISAVGHRSRSEMTLALLWRPSTTGIATT